MKRLVFLLPAIALAAACGDASRATAPLLPHTPAFGISDGANTGGGASNGDFFFLPPMVKDPGGSVAYDAAAFDATRSPSVVICLLTTAAPYECESTVRTFAGSAIALSAADQLYQVNWHTDLDGLIVGRYYRISVFDGAHLLGYADVDPVNSGKDLRNVVTGEYIGLVDGRTLPIKFRLEHSPRCEGAEDCGEAVVTNEGGFVETSSGYAIARFPAGWLPEGFEQVIVTIRRVDIGAAEGQSPSCHGLALREFEGCYDYATYPSVGTFAKAAIVSTCVDMEAAGAYEDYLQLYASDPGAAPRALAPASIPEMNEARCIGFEGTPSPAGEIGLLDRLGGAAWGLASRVGRAIGPRTAHAVDIGRGGAIDGFSHVGWALPTALVGVAPEGGTTTATVGGSVPVSVRVMSAHASAHDPVGLAGFTVSFGVASPARENPTLTAVTDANGIATVSVPLPVAGLFQVTATAEGVPGTVTTSITAEVACVPDVPIGFEQYPDCTPTPAATTVGGEFASRNVIFSFDPVSDVQAFRPALQLSSNNPQGVLSHVVTAAPLPSGGWYNGTLAMDFPAAVSAVSFTGVVNATASYAPVAYDASGSVIESAVVSRGSVVIYPECAQCVQYRSERLTISSPDVPIARLTVPMPIAVVFIDDLQF